jgi:hypothetical protein
MDGIAAVEARIREIESRLGTGIGVAGGRLGTASTTPTADTVDFAAALDQAQASTATGTSMPATSGQLNKAGVDPAQWARDFLQRLGMPVTAENVRAMTAWQQAEGTAAHFNPLATTQAGFAGETRFNSVGVKNYVSYADGLAANIKAITNGRYGNILSALQAGNNAMDVARAIANSPWGTGGLVERILSSQR